MVGTTSDWEDELGRWLEPFLERLGHRSRQRMCPLYVAGLIGPGDRKSVQPMAERLAPGAYDQLHHFVAAGVWKEAPPSLNPAGNSYSISSAGSTSAPQSSSPRTSRSGSGRASSVIPR